MMKVKCQSVEEEYLGQYDDLPIKIGFPEKVDKGFLKKTVTFFTAIAVPLGKVVKRSFEDFCLIIILFRVYPRLIPY